MSLYENIHKRRKSGKKMRKRGDKGAPTDEAFRRAALTAKKPTKKKEEACQKEEDLKCPEELELTDLKNRQTAKEEQKEGHKEKEEGD